MIVHNANIIKLWSLLFIIENTAEALLSHRHSRISSFTHHDYAYHNKHDHNYYYYYTSKNQPSIIRHPLAIICASTTSAITESTVLDDRASYYAKKVADYARSHEKGSADQALSILEEMEQMNIPYQPYLYNLVLSSLAKSANLDGDDDDDEDADGGSRISSAQKATNLLNKMIDKGIANTISYNTCIHAYAKSNKAIKGSENGKAAENLLLSIESSKTLRPDVITYTSTMDAILRSGEPNSAQRAEAILQRMFELSEKDDHHHSIQPNTITLNTVMHAWATSGEPDGPQRAEAILQKMEMVYERVKSNHIQPNTISYTTYVQYHGVIYFYSCFHEKEMLINEHTHTMEIYDLFYQGYGCICEIYTERCSFECGADIQTNGKDVQQWK